MLKVLTHPTSGRTFKMGRTPSRPQRHLRFADYLTSTPLPVPPAVEHYTGKAYGGLKQMLANNVLGNCTAAAAGHIIDLWRGNANAGLPWVTDEQAIAFYSASTGYNPADPSTDTGGDLVTCMTTWRDKGFFADGSSKLTGWASVDATQTQEVKQAIYLFETVYAGLNLADAWVTHLPDSNGYTWGVAGNPDPTNGHAIMGCGYNEPGLTVDSWGLFGTMPWDAVAKYLSVPNGGEMYVPLSQDIIDKATGKTPNGFDFEGLTTDLENFR